MRVKSQLVFHHRRQSIVALAKIYRPCRYHDAQRPA